jgi:hypothetical protein
MEKLCARHARYFEAGEDLQTAISSLELIPQA